MITVQAKLNYSISFNSKCVTNDFASWKKFENILQQNVSHKKMKVNIIRKLYDFILDSLFDYNLLKRKNVIFDNDGLISFKSYKNNSFRKFRRDSDKKPIIYEEKVPSGIKRVYSPSGENLESEIFPDNTIRNYKGCKTPNSCTVFKIPIIGKLVYNNHKKSCLIKEILPNGIIKIYERGHLLKINYPNINEII